MTFIQHGINAVTLVNVKQGIEAQVQKSDVNNVVIRKKQIARKRKVSTKKTERKKMQKIVEDLESKIASQTD